MSKHNLALPTIDEIISLLKRTRLPTLIIEGKDDLIVYKRVEEKFYNENLSVLPVGGRNNILKIFDRRHELPPQCKIIFIADKDTWAITGIPGEYSSERLLFTSGYSIENDVFQDGRIDSYMSKHEKDKFNHELEKFISWYSIALQRHLEGDEESIKTHPNNILDNDIEFQKLTKLKEGENFPSEHHKEISRNYKMLLRGKSLMQLAMRQLSYTGRSARHTEKSFIEHVAVNPGPLINKIIHQIEINLKAPLL